LLVPRRSSYVAAMTDDVGPPLQERSRLTHARLLAAGTHLLETGGIEALTITAVAARAKVAVGSVYRRFGSKENLLHAIQTEFTEQYVEELRARLAEKPASARPHDLVAHAVASFSDMFRARARLLRVFILFATDSEEAFAVGQAANLACAVAFREALHPLRKSIHRPDPDVAIDFAFRLMYATCAHRVIHGAKLESSKAPSWAQLILELQSAVTLYLLAKA
jgi:AcrR family transcriptional regulator